MPDILFHPLTRQQLDAYLKAPAHALLLIGPGGAGKRTLAHWLAATLLGVPLNKVPGHAYVTVIRSADGKAIGIEAVRELEHFFRLKVPADRVINRVAIIEDGHLLTAEAQNALLKTLEEPPVASGLILTTSYPQALLPTIHSRTQAVRVLQPDNASLQAHFTERGFTADTIDRAYSMSGGLPGLMDGLLEQANHPLVPATAWARRLLQASAYERLLAVDELSKQRQLCLDVLFILQQMAHLGLQRATAGRATRWQCVLSASYQASEALAGNAQPKLVLTDLMVNLT